MYFQGQNGRPGLRIISGKKQFMVMVLKSHFYCSTKSGSVCLLDEIHRRVILIYSQGTCTFTLENVGFK